MALPVPQRLLAVLRRSHLPHGPGGAAGAASPQPGLRELMEAVPGLREELVQRARGAGLLVGWVVVVLTPAWTVVDRVLVPDLADTFLLVRLLSDVPMLAAMFVLWRRPVATIRPERLTFFILAVLQIELAWMIPQVDEVPFYLLGFTLAIYASGCILVARPRWTGRLIGVSWTALTVCVLLSPGRLPTADLVAIGIFLSTASIIAQLAHLRRYALNGRELVTRIRLEREQQRSRVLLAQLERLSHEDPLTGLANRRRWDTELAMRCAEARQHGSVLSVVLVDLDHFKDVNDRHGHAGGDEALRQVAGLLTDRVRSGDLVARLGGDELAVLMPGAGMGRAVVLAEELRYDATQLEPAGFVRGGLTLSIGVAATAGEESFPVELMSRADEQLYRAKITRNAVGAPHPVVPRPTAPQDAARLHPTG